MEMKPEDLKKYNLKHPMPPPKRGMYAPHGQFFQCATQEEMDTLLAAGWTDNAFDHGYKPEKAKWIEKWDDVVIGDGKPKEKPEAVAVRDLAAELAAAQAEIAALKAAKKPGRPAKAQA